MPSVPQEPVRGEPAPSAAGDHPTEIDPGLAVRPPRDPTHTVLFPREPLPPTPKSATERPLSDGYAPRYSGSRTDASYGDHDGDVLGGRYVLRGVGEEKKPLGQGAFGEVWRAFDRAFEREVALKILKQRMCRPAVVLRFELEKQLVARMEHSNIAKVFEAGTLEDGRPFFAMELIRGLTLLEYCQQRRLSIEGRLRLFVSICRAVQHAHERFVLHRDLKPSNIMVVEHDGQAVPKVIDFGIAKVIEEGEFSAEAAATMEGSIKGTPAYMSPEQTRRSEDLTVRSDVYTLGVILFEMLTADTPLSHRRTRVLDFFQLVGVICHEEPLAPSVAILKRDAALLGATFAPLTTTASLVRQLKGDVDVIVLRALQKEPARRYESAAELAADVERHLGHEPIFARPPSLWYRGAKFFQRHQAAGIAAAVVLAALLATAAVSTASYFSVSESLGREQLARAKAVAAEQVASHQKGQAESARNLAQQKEAEARAARDAAVIARGESENLLNYMLYDLRQQLEPLGRSRLLAGVSEEAERYFARQPRSTDDDTLERNRAVMSYNRGYILLAQGDVEGAGKAFRQARAAMAQRLQAHESAARRLDFATASHGLGLALRASGQADEARPIFEEILPFLRARHAEHDAEASRLLAATLEQLGELRLRQGPLDKARELFLEQESRLREVQSTAPDDTRIVLALAVACEKVGGAWQREGQPAQALPKFQEEVDLLRKLSGDHPDDLQLRRSLAVGLEKLGNALLALERTAEARLRFEERLRESELLVRIDPRRVEFRRDVAVAHQRLAAALLASRDFAGARTEAQTDLSLTTVLAKENPLNPSLQADLASSELQMGYALLKVGTSAPARVPEADAHLDRSAKILRRLAEGGQLDERGQTLLNEVETARDELSRPPPIAAPPSPRAR